MSIQRLDSDDADAAAATLGEALFDDPLLQIVAPDDATTALGSVVHESAVAVRAALG